MSSGQYENSVKLTYRQRIFIREYLLTMNGNKAAKRAGYKGSYSVLSTVAHELLKHPLIIEAINGHLPSVDEIESPLSRKNTRAQYVYLMKADNGLIKIGKTVNLEARLSSINNVSPIDIRLVAFKLDMFASRLESDLHKHYHSKRVKGEWFNLTLADIKEITRVHGWTQENPD